MKYFEKVAYDQFSTKLLDDKISPWADWTNRSLDSHIVPTAKFIKKRYPKAELEYKISQQPKGMELIPDKQKFKDDPLTHVGKAKSVKGLKKQLLEGGFNPGTGSQGYVRAEIPLNQANIKDLKRVAKSQKKPKRILGLIPRTKMQSKKEISKADREALLDYISKTKRR